MMLPGVIQQASNIYVSEPNVFISTWDTTPTMHRVSESNQIQLPLDFDGTYDFIVYWGDGQYDLITDRDQPERRHTYAEEGIYQITIKGVCDGFGFRWGSYSEGKNTSVQEDSGKLLSISQWGDVKLHSKGWQFTRCINLGHFHFDPKPFVNITYAEHMFSSMSLNVDVTNLDTSNYTNMRWMFNQNNGFRRDIGGWDVSNVTNMSGMFRYASNFSRNLTGWCVQHISSEPEEFAFGSGLSEGTKPIWGTCP